MTSSMASLNRNSIYFYRSFLHSGLYQNIILLIKKAYHTKIYAAGTYLLFIQSNVHCFTSSSIEYIMHITSLSLI